MVALDDYYPLTKDSKVALYTVEALFAGHNDHTTYLAFDNALNRHVLLREHTPSHIISRKEGTQDIIIDPDYTDEYVESKERFLHGARLLSSFNHRSLERTFEILETNNTHYLVNTYVIGMPLMEYAKAYPQIREKESCLLFLMEHLFSGMRHAHKNGVLHNNLTPFNIRIPSQTAIPLIIGFDPLRSDFICDPAHHLYLAPELSEGTSKTNISTDLYSLGSVLYHILTQEAPQQGSRYKPLADNPHFREKFHHQLLESIDRARHPRCDCRFQSIDEWITCINKIPAQTTRPEELHIPSETDDTIAITRPLHQYPQQVNTKPSEAEPIHSHRRPKKENPLKALWRWLNT